MSKTTATQRNDGLVVRAKQLVTYFCELHFPLIQELSVVNKGGASFGDCDWGIITFKKRKTDIYIYLICHIKSYVVLCRCLELTPILFLFHQENWN